MVGKKNGMERNMVPTFLDGPECHKGVWKGQGVELTQEAHEQMDKTSATKGKMRVLTSDACTNADGTNRPGMGAFMGEESVFIDSPPSTLGSDEHIGYWEYIVGHKLIIERWAHLLKGERLLWRCDNKIAIAAINKGYSGLESVDKLLPELGEALWELKITPYAVHIPGVWNDKADGISRRKIKASTCEYVMKNHFYEDVCERLRNRKGIVKPFTNHTLDGYANEENAKCSEYCTEQSQFELKSLNNHDSWVSCDYKNVPIMLNHLLKEKQKHTTSVRATLAIPHWEDAPWLTKLSKHCTLIHNYPRGTRMFTARRTHAVLGDDLAALPTEAGPIPWELGLDIWRLD